MALVLQQQAIRRMCHDLSIQMRSTWERSLSHSSRMIRPLPMRAELLTFQWGQQSAPSRACSPLADLQSLNEPVVLVTGSAGSGKSALLRWLAYQHASQIIADDAHGMLPVYEDLSTTDPKLVRAGLSAVLEASFASSGPTDDGLQDASRGRKLFLLDTLDYLPFGVQRRLMYDASRWSLAHGDRFLFASRLTDCHDASCFELPRLIELSLQGLQPAALDRFLQDVVPQQQQAQHPELVKGILEGSHLLHHPSHFSAGLQILLDESSSSERGPRRASPGVPELLDNAVLSVLGSAIDRGNHKAVRRFREYREVFEHVCLEAALAGYRTTLPADHVASLLQASRFPGDAGERHSHLAARACAAAEAVGLLVQARDSGTYQLPTEDFLLHFAGRSLAQLILRNGKDTRMRRYLSAVWQYRRLDRALASMLTLLMTADGSQVAARAAWRYLVETDALAALSLLDLALLPELREFVKPLTAQDDSVLACRAWSVLARLEGHYATCDVIARAQYNSSTLLALIFGRPQGRSTIRSIRDHLDTHGFDDEAALLRSVYMDRAMDDDVRAAALDAVGRFGLSYNIEDIAPLITKATHTNTRYSAIFLLWRHDRTATQEMLCKLFTVYADEADENEWPHVLLSARASLGRDFGEFVAWVLMTDRTPRALTDLILEDAELHSDPRVQRAIDGLVHSKPDAVTLLWALRAMGGYNPCRARSLLHSVIEHARAQNHPDIAASAAMELVPLSRADAARAARTLTTSGSPDMRLHCAARLLDVEPDIANQTLCNGRLVQQCSKSRLEECLSILATKQGGHVIAALEAIREHAPQAQVRGHARKILEQLTTMRHGTEGASAKPVAIRKHDRLLYEVEHLDPHRVPEALSVLRACETAMSRTDGLSRVVIWEVARRHGEAAAHLLRAVAQDSECGPRMRIAAANQLGYWKPEGAVSMLLNLLESMPAPEVEEACTLLGHTARGDDKLWRCVQVASQFQRLSPAQQRHVARAADRRLLSTEWGDDDACESLDIQETTQPSDEQHVLKLIIAQLVATRDKRPDKELVMTLYLLLCDASGETPSVRSAEKWAAENGYGWSRESLRKTNTFERWQKTTGSKEQWRLETIRKTRRTLPGN